MSVLQQYSPTLSELYCGAALLLVAGVGYVCARLYRNPLKSGKLGKPHIDTLPSYPMYDTLLAFGDSITQFGSNPNISGFVLHLSGYYSRRMDVLNRGFSGYNTRDALRVASHVFPRSTGMSQKGPERSFAFPETPKAPHLCLLFFGANDARLAPYAQHVPLDEFYENLHKLVMLLRDPNSDYYSPDTRIMFITPPAIGDRMVEDVARRNGYEPDRKNAVTKLYADAVKKVAKEHDLPVVDIWTAIEDLVRGSTSVDSPDCKTENNVAGFVESNTAEHDVPTEGASTSPFEGYEKYLLDGLHLNHSGNELLFRLIVSEIEKTWSSENTA